MVLTEAEVVLGFFERRTALGQGVVGQRLGEQRLGARIVGFVDGQDTPLDLGLDALRLTATTGIASWEVESLRLGALLPNYGYRTELLVFEGGRVVEETSGSDEYTTTFVVDSGELELPSVFESCLEEGPEDWAVCLRSAMAPGNPLTLPELTCPEA